MHARKKISIFNRTLIGQSILGSLIKMNPFSLIRNPVIFMVEAGAALTSVFVVVMVFQGDFSSFNLQIAGWLWFTVLFANFSEAIAEGRGKAQAESLKKSRSQLKARKLTGKQEVIVSATELKKGDIVICESGDVIPTDGEVTDGIASVDESAVTGESAPVIRES